MNTFGPINTQSNFLPVQFDLPEDPQQAREYVNKRERLTSNVVNIKENGNFETLELISGQQWFSTDPIGTPLRPRFAFRKVIDFGALPNASTKSVPHDIAIDSNTIFTRIFATSTNPGVKFVPIPYVNVTTPTDGIEIFIDATNVNIKTTTANWTAFTTTYVVLEYIKN